MIAATAVATKLSTKLQYDTTQYNTVYNGGQKGGYAESRWTLISFVGDNYPIPNTTELKKNLDLTLKTVFVFVYYIYFHRNGSVLHWSEALPEAKPIPQPNHHRPQPRRQEGLHKEGLKDQPSGVSHSVSNAFEIVYL